MTDYQDQINLQYGQDNLGDKLMQTLRSAGKKIHQLGREDLSTFDELHIGGIAQTRKLARLIPDLQPNMRVLDVGSGLGGPARTLAAEFGCYVVGLDITSVFCQIAELLTEVVQLTPQVTFWQGDALAMPFEDNTFDVAWMQFSGMNIADKVSLYQQCWRVVRDGGYLAIHDVMEGRVAELHYPVFWAEDETLNFLRPVVQIQEILVQQGFHEMIWNDVTDQAIMWLHEAHEARTQDIVIPMGPNDLSVSNSSQKVANTLRNLEENRATVIQAVYEVHKEADAQ